MTQAESRSAFEAARASGRSALQALAREHLPLVASLARRFPGGLYEPEEIYQQGCIGLMKAIIRYRPECGAAFSTYAVPVILGEMRQLSRQCASVHIPRPERELRQRIRRVSAALTAALGHEPSVRELADAMRMDPEELMLATEEISVASCDEESEGGTPLSDTLADPDDWQTRLELRDLIARLPERDRRLMTCRHLEGLTQRETALRLGMTQLQVSRREAVLRRQLRDAWYNA